jgi:hypothetical protein
MLAISDRGRPTNRVCKVRYMKNSEKSVAEELEILREDLLSFYKKVAFFYSTIAYSTVLTVKSTV